MCTAANWQIAEFLTPLALGDAIRTGAIFAGRNDSQRTSFQPPGSQPNVSIAKDGSLIPGTPCSPSQVTGLTDPTGHLHR